MHPAVAVGLVFGGCCSNVVFLELLARQFPGCGNIVTFSQFLFIALEGFIFEANFGRKRPAIPIRNYFIMVAMFFTVSVVNNYALNLNIAMPLHMIFRSGSLIASMALGIIILKKRYSVSKYSSIALVSLGIFTCTFMSAKQVVSLHLFTPLFAGNKSHFFGLRGNRKKLLFLASCGRQEQASDSSSNQEDGPQAFLWWLLGIAALTFALLMSARMGIFQETLYKKFGKHSKEALFYNHALPLPGFLLLAPNIYQHAVLFSQSELFQVPVIGLTLPIMWFYLLMNVITQACSETAATGHLNPSEKENLLPHYQEKRTSSCLTQPWKRHQDSEEEAGTAQTESCV
ncbi:nucleotide sugar transporter SLC35B4 isoform X4 [Haemorhous mexicanus]|uniref:nucleotide sugar transporter SLC35B4 isoform X4 n=1 Tax=Haemorhous mexicanus TaxID=30427 RepID=UPI0028BE4103|nr:nucleotide sugar transporter SLC35B4 isoform X4 [Haemorhous mexicanus]